MVDIRTSLKESMLERAHVRRGKYVEAFELIRAVLALDGQYVRAHLALLEEVEFFLNDPIVRIRAGLPRVDVPVIDASRIMRLTIFQKRKDRPAILESIVQRMGMTNDDTKALLSIARELFDQNSYLKSERRGEIGR